MCDDKKEIKNIVLLFQIPSWMRNDTLVIVVSTSIILYVRDFPSHIEKNKALLRYNVDVMQRLQSAECEAWNALYV